VSGWIFDVILTVLPGTVLFDMCLVSNDRRRTKNILDLLHTLPCMSNEARGHETETYKAH
jgi:hypothetical protein